MKHPTKHLNGEEFVTVLEVNNERNREMDCGLASSAFVTVVSLESNTTSEAEVTAMEEEVVMYRLPGERLGMGLKFEGGMQALECVSHVFIQSVAPDSPAARTATSWGGLAEADEILKIDGRAVNRMTRVDCVTTLKKAPVAITLQVGHAILCEEPKTGCRNGASARCVQNGKAAINRREVLTGSSSSAPAVPLPPKPGRFIDASRGKKLPEVPVTPPPVPPRKIKVTRKESVSSSDSSTASPPTIRGTNLASEEPEAVGFKAGSILGMKLPGWEELMQRRSSGPEELVLPVAPHTYIDLIAEEDRRSLMNEYESDDTGSSVSTVVDRMSTTVISLQSLHCNDRESPPPLAARSTTLDLSQVLGPFEKLEKEIEADFAVASPHCDKNGFCEDQKNVSPTVDRPLDDEQECIEEEEDSNGQLIKVTDELLVPETRPRLSSSDPTDDGCKMTDDNYQKANGGLNDDVVPQEIIVEPEPEEELEQQDLNDRKVSPPPVPPRKLKNVKRTNSNGLPAFSEDDFDDPIIALTFPIIGNLLQELEQFPEFHRSTPT